MSSQLPDPSPSSSSTKPHVPISAPDATSSAPAIQGDNTGGVIPYKNPQALWAYYLGLFALIPLLGLFMGPTALALGLRGLKFGRENPAVKGQAHAWIGIVLGAMWTLIHWILLIVSIAAMMSRAR